MRWRSCSPGAARATPTRTAGSSRETALPSAEDLPKGTVATVVGVPAKAAAPLEAPYEDCEGKEVTPDVGEITELEYTCAFIQAAAAAELKETPHPGDAKYDEVRESAMTSLIEAAWLQAVAAEEGISVSKTEIAKELATCRKSTSRRNPNTRNSWRDPTTAPTTPKKGSSSSSSPTGSSSGPNRGRSRASWPKKKP